MQALPLPQGFEGCLIHFASGNFAEKHDLTLFVKPFSGHCPAIKSQNLPQSHSQIEHFLTF